MPVKSFAMLGKMYEDQTIHGWFASEKLDGCRGLWLPNFDPQFSNDPDVEPTGLWTRDAKVIHAPKWWLQHLPKDTPLDGELHIGPQSFQETMSVVRKKTPVILEWQRVGFKAFDMPIVMEPGLIKFRKHEMPIPKLYLHPTLKEQLGFRFTYHLLQQLPQNEIFKVVEQVRVKDRAHVMQLMEEVTSRGGEGLMLREPYSKWEQCRSNNLLKVKPFEIMEVEVVGYYYGDGKYYGMMGALEVKDKIGHVFKVSGFTDDERRVPSNGLPFHRSSKDDCYFRNGSTIKIKYRELTKGGIPKEARYERA